MNDEQWNKTYQTAINIWNMLEVTKNPNVDLETNTCPMHPNHFFQLSNVSGFNKMNGYTYKEYVEKWRKRSIASNSLVTKT